MAMSTRTAAALLATSVLMFAALYYMSTVQSDDLRLRGANKLETVAMCIYQSVFVSTFGSPLSAPSSTTAALLVVVNRVVATTMILTIVLSTRPTAGALT